MFGKRLLSTKLGKALAITALIGAASLHNPGTAEAQNGFETLRGTKGLVMLFSRSLAW